MNILHISRTMGQGGAEKVVFQICKNITNNKMVIASIGGSYESELLKMDIKHYIIPDLDSKNLYLMLKTYFILRRIIKNERIDIVHSHHRMAAFYSKLLSVFHKGFKRIYTSHNIFYNKIILLRFALKGSKVVAVGDGVKKNLINTYGISPDNISVIYNSIEIPKKVDEIKDDLFTKKENKILIGNIGRLSEQKGFDIFIKAINPIIQRNKNVYGIIIGDGELKDELIELSKKLNIEKNIIFLGYRKDVIALINKMDFIVLSSRWEGFPLTPIEVFSQKKTIIASNIDGNNEIVINNYNGLLFEKDNIEDLNSKIELFIHMNKDEYERNAYNDYINKYDFKTFINKYKEEYEKINK